MTTTQSKLHKWMNNPTISGIFALLLIVSIVATTIHMVTHKPTNADYIVLVLLISAFAMETYSFVYLTVSKRLARKDRFSATLDSDANV